MADYRLFRPTYTDRTTGQQRESPTYQIAFVDHMKRRQKFTAERRERQSRQIADRLMELIDCRRRGTTPEDRLRIWVETLPERQRERLAEMNLIERQATAGMIASLVGYLEGRPATDTKPAEPGYRQSLEAKGVTAKHVDLTCKRIANILAGAGFSVWRDLVAAGAATRVEMWLGQQRAAGTMTVKTAGYYVREFKAFCRWMKKHGHAPAVAMEELTKPEHGGVDEVERRPLSVAEMRLLLASASKGPTRQRTSGADRAFLYRFAFETGIRPNQIRALTVASFDLDADPPTVTSAARYVKRRRKHVQVLRPAIAAELAERFVTMMPTAQAIRMPKSRDHMADMIRFDLATARAEWIDAAGEDDKEREKRQRSDFLAATDHQGRRAVFYSTRHGHGTALAAAGVPEKDIAASMHHASRRTTERYLHSDQKAVRSAIDAMPDLAYPLPAIATGTAGVEPGSDATVARRLSGACSTGASSMESGGVGRADRPIAKNAKTPENAVIQGENANRLLDGIGRRSGFKIRRRKA